MKFLTRHYDTSRWENPSSKGIFTVHASLVGITRKIHHFVFVFSKNDFNGPYTVLKGVLTSRRDAWCPNVIQVLHTNTFNPEIYLDHPAINYCDSKELATHFARVLVQQLKAKYINVNMFGKSRIEKKWISKGNGFMSKFITGDCDSSI